MSEKNSMIFFYDWKSLFEELSDAEIGKLVMAALKYDQSGEDTKFSDKGMRVAFKAIKNSINVSNEKYQAACEKKRKAMERRWQHNKNSNLYNSIDNYKQSSDTDTDTDTVTVTDTVTDTDTESGSGSGSKAAEAATPPRPPRISDDDLITVRTEWNNQDCTRNVQVITDTRFWKICELARFGTEKLIQTIRELDSQEYLREQAKVGKKVDFDWFLKPDNYQNILEGKYKEVYGSGGGGVGGLQIDWGSLEDNCG